MPTGSCFDSLQRCLSLCWVSSWLQFDANLKSSSPRLADWDYRSLTVFLRILSLSPPELLFPCRTEVRANLCTREFCRSVHFLCGLCDGEIVLATLYFPFNGRSASDLSFHRKMLVSQSGLNLARINGVNVKDCQSIVPHWFEVSLLNWKVRMLTLVLFCIILQLVWDILCDSKDFCV